MRVDPDALVGELGVGARQRVEILKVLYRGARIIILDEPTAVLVPQEVEELFDSLRELVAAGATVIFISHKLNEVLSVADAITVIRAGRTVAEVLPSEVTARQLAELMVGTELPSPETRTIAPSDVVALEVRGVTVLDGGRTVLHDIDLTLHQGEIVGVAGVEGNGQDELIDVILGIESPQTGSVLLDGTDITKLGTRGRREAGLGYIPQDRQRDGLLLGAPLWENVVLGHQTRVPFARGPFIDARAVARTHEADHRGVRRPHARPGRGRPRAVRRQPAEAHRRPRDDGRPQGADRRPARHAASTSAPKPPSGTTSARPALPTWPCCSSRPTSTS